jgi:NAD(P)H-hydrate epimerase
LNTDTAAVQADRFAAADALARQYAASVVLKGAGTLVAGAHGDTGDISLCDRGHPGMASGGMGDILTGMIAGVAAQCADLHQAARAGVWLHAAAGDEAAGGGERGIVATDLLMHLGGVLNGNV